MLDQHARRRWSLAHDPRETDIDVVNATQGLFDGANTLRQFAYRRPEHGREERAEVAHPSQRDAKPMQILGRFRSTQSRELERAAQRFSQIVASKFLDGTRRLGPDKRSE